MSQAADVRVDAVVVTWNSAAHLDTCLDALALQRGVRVSATVVDNASADESAAVASRHDGVDVLRLRRNTGYTRGVHAGVRRGDAPYVLLCNPDSEPEPDCVARLVHLLESTPQAGAVVPVLVGLDGVPQRMLYRFPRLTDAFFCFTEVGHHLDRRLGKPGERRYAMALPPDGRPAPVEQCGGACVLLRRDGIEELLDDGFPLFFSDTELCWRLRQRGQSLWCEPAAVARHLQGASVDRLRGVTILHELQRSLRRFYALHERRGRRTALDALLVADLTIRTVARGTRRRSLHAARAELDLLRRLWTDRPAPDAPWIEGDEAEAVVRDVSR